MFFFKDWFLIQRELTTIFTEISPKELNKCLQKFYLSVRKRAAVRSLRAKILLENKTNDALTVQVLGRFKTSRDCCFGFTRAWSTEQKKKKNRFLLKCKTSLVKTIFQPLHKASTDFQLYWDTLVWKSHKTTKQGLFKGF